MANMKQPMMTPGAGQQAGQGAALKMALQGPGQGPTQKKGAVPPPVQPPPMGQPGPFQPMQGPSPASMVQPQQGGMQGGGPPGMGGQPGMGGPDIMALLQKLLQGGM